MGTPQAEDAGRRHQGQGRSCAVRARSNPDEAIARHLRRRSLLVVRLARSINRDPRCLYDTAPVLLFPRQIGCKLIGGDRPCLDPQSRKGLLDFGGGERAGDRLVETCLIMSGVPGGATIPVIDVMTN